MRGDKKSPQAICSLRRRGWGGRIRQGKPCRLQQFICPFCFAKDGLIGSNPAEKLNKKITDTVLCLLFFWLGWQDSNLRMQQSKCCVLPLDDTPILSLLFILIIPKYSNIIKHFNIPKYSNIPKSYLIVKTPPNLIDRRS